MITAQKITSLLQEVAGEDLVQEVPYPIVVPMSLETLPRILAVARTEKFHVMIIGSGSSFSDNFVLRNKNVIVITTSALTATEKISQTTVRLQCGVQLSKIFSNAADLDRKTIGGLIASDDSPQRSESLRTLLPRMLRLEVLTADGQFRSFSLNSTAITSDASNGSFWFGSRGKLGIITSVDILSPLPLPILMDKPAASVENNTSRIATLLSKDELTSFIDKENIFAW